MRLIITRHGETEENKAGILQGQLPGVLSGLGKKQAEKLGERLSNEKIDLIISSDLARAHDTAKIIGKFHPDVEIIPEKKLREKFLGSLQGKTKESLGFSKEELIADIIEGRDTEDTDAFFTRAGAFVEEVLKRPEENILLVGHNGICKAVLGNLLKIKNLQEIVGLKNTSVNIFEEENGEIKIKLLNDVEHLK